MNATRVNCFTWHAPFDERMFTEGGIRAGSRDGRDTYLYWGDFKITNGSIIGVIKPPVGEQTVVLVETKAGVENHDLKCDPHFRDCNTWIGADGVPTVWSRGDWRNPEKKQLFRLLPGEHILFIDAKKEVTKLTAGECGTCPERQRATYTEVADYVLGEARKRGDNPSTRAWCFHALQELGCQSQLWSFHRMFPDFHRK